MLTLFPLIELLLSDILKSITWLHMLYFFSCRRVRLIRIESIVSLGLRLFKWLVLAYKIWIDWLYIQLIELRISLILHLLIGTWSVFNTSILLALAGECVVLGYDVTISITDWWSTSLITCTDSVVVRKFMHGLCFLFGIFLFLNLLLLLLLCNLIWQKVPILVLFLLSFNELSSLSFAFQSNGCYWHLLVCLNHWSSWSIFKLWKLTFRLQILCST